MNSWPVLKLSAETGIAVCLKVEQDGTLKPSYRKLIWAGGTGWQRRGPKFDSDGNWRERLLVLRYGFLFSSNLNFECIWILNYNVRIRNYNVDIKYRTRSGMSGNSFLRRCIINFITFESSYENCAGFRTPFVSKSIRAHVRFATS